MSDFKINTPTSVHFGEGTAGTVCSVLEVSSGSVALVRGSGGAASATIAEDLHTHGLDVVEIRVNGEPSISTINAALEQCDGIDIRGIVACGGGSVIDSGKALAFCLSNRIRLPDDLAQVEKTLLATPPAIKLIAIPTTAGTGAEVTSNAVLATASFENQPARTRPVSRYRPGRSEPDDIGTEKRGPWLRVGCGGANHRILHLSLRDSFLAMR